MSLFNGLKIEEIEKSLIIFCLFVELASELFLLFKFLSRELLLFVVVNFVSSH